MFRLRPFSIRPFFCFFFLDSIPLTIDNANALFQQNAGMVLRDPELLPMNKIG